MIKSIKAVAPETAQKKKPVKSGSNKKPKSFPVIAIGGSAGSFSAYEKFFAHMPANSGVAIVIIMHLDPLHKSQLSEVMQRYTAIPVIEATDGMLVAPDHIYIIPSNKDMGIHNGKLLLLAASKPEGIRQPIDYFFQSLANDQWNRSVAVVLSGMGADGETGIRMIKENLGMTIAQDPDTADYDSMPLAAIGTNLVDYVLAPEEMPLRIIEYLNHPVIAEEADDSLKMSLKNNNAIQKILMLLRSHTGNDFALYKKSTITRRIERRIAYYQFTDYAQYAGYLKDNPEEIDSLFNELLIGVTKFFRDAGAFESLKLLLKELIRQKKDDDPVRVWVAGCSTGEEAYSVAMLLMECIDTLKRKIISKIQIYATDLDPAALEHARAGVYHENIVAEVSPERLKKFFTREEDRFRVKKELRDIIVFAQQNLIKDPPFIKLDLLCCRNMLIYFTPELQKRIIPLFYYALNPNGIMFMGPAETIGGFTDMFRSLDPKWKIFNRQEGNIMLGNMIDFPFHTTKQYLHTLKSNDVSIPKQKRSFTDIFNKILIDKFLPPSVLVNEKGDILYNNGNTGKYLELPRGETVANNILKLAREELKYALSSSLHQALNSDDTLTLDDITLKEGKDLRLVSIRVTSVREQEAPSLVLFVFEDHGLIKTDKKPDLQSSLTNRNSVTEALKKELVYTKQQLTTTVEQMEGSMEKLRLSNEELQSTNEELQSTNEESLTTKEEMQSLNEELMTVNSQYQLKAEELTRLNNDMKNLLDATEVCTLFLDNDLNILRYTPQVRHLFNLIASDVGRPINHVVSNFEQPINENDIREVIDKLTIKVTDLRTKDNEWYRVRIMPYRTLDNYISGAVLTLTQITDFKQMQSKLEVLKDYAASILNELPDAVIQMDKDFHISGANILALKLFNIAQHDLQGQSAVEFLKKLWKTEEPEYLFKQCLSERKEVSAAVTTKTKQPKVYQLTARPFFEQTETTPLIVLRINENQDSA
ncbi:CheR family methyltransferase [Mucilaginibacter angelicae]|uniref:protein-glutamate O-methyltransferase n=1 Tax=Mucilaginibacter angelicae TaxID=869718 RepID=A0ABV6L2B0_9SPHI